MGLRVRVGVSRSCQGSLVTVRGSGAAVVELVLGLGSGVELGVETGVGEG